MNEEGDLKPLGTCCAHIGFILGTFGPYLTGLGHPLGLLLLFSFLFSSLLSFERERGERYQKFRTMPPQNCCQSLEPLGCEKIVYSSKSPSICNLN